MSGCEGKVIQLVNEGLQLISQIPVSGPHVDYMSYARTKFFGALELLQKEVKDDGGQEDRRAPSNQ